ncbi:hypothetical protein AB0M72_13220 [Nocardiopsis dassonvillei]
MTDECSYHRAVLGAIGKLVERGQTVTVPNPCFDAMVASLSEPAQPIRELASAVREHRSVVRTV